jgi:hypothetical protein
MNAENSPINHSSQTQMIKDLATIPPDVDTPVFPLTLVVKTVNLSDMSRFMIATDEGDAVRVSDFEDEQEEECFDRVEATVDKVTWEGKGKGFNIWQGRMKPRDKFVLTHEQVIRLGTPTSHSEQLQEIEELAVDVAADLEGAVEGD